MEKCWRVHNFILEIWYRKIMSEGLFLDELFLAHFLLQPLEGSIWLTTNRLNSGLETRNKRKDETMWSKCIHFTIKQVRHVCQSRMIHFLLFKHWFILLLLYRSILFFIHFFLSLSLMIFCLLWTSSKTFKVISTSVLLCPGVLAPAASASGAHYVGYWSSRCPWPCASLETTQNNSATQPGMLSKAGVENEIEKFVCVSLGINLNSM